MAAGRILAPATRNLSNMKKLSDLLTIFFAAQAVSTLHATVLTSFLDSDDQGAFKGDGTIGMIMPMVKSAT